MPILSNLPQLFDAETCQASIRRLRWKDRPLQCPRCQSLDIGPWGNYHYRSGCQRYRCRDGTRTFNDLPGTLMHQSKRSLPHWLLATFLLCLACSSRRIAREVGVHIRTNSRWCWWLRNAALSYEMERQLEGTIEADDLYHTAGHKGPAQGGGKKSLGHRARGWRKKREPGRGHYDKDRPAIIAWVSRQGGVVVHATRDFTVKTVQKAADIAVKAGSRLYTDSASSYRALTGYVHDFVNDTQKEYARGDVHENRAECLFSLLKPYLRVFRGISKTAQQEETCDSTPFSLSYCHVNSCCLPKCKREISPVGRNRQFFCLLKPMKRFSGDFRDKVPVPNGNREGQHSNGVSSHVSSRRAYPRGSAS